MSRRLYRTFMDYSLRTMVLLHYTTLLITAILLRRQKSHRQKCPNVLPNALTIL